MPERAASTTYGLALAFVLGAVTAVAVYGLGFVTGTSSFWDYPPTDWNSHVIGYRAYLLDRWRFPLFHIGTLEEPGGINLLYLDALPIVALPAKLLGPIVPAFARTLWFNPFGAWHVLSYGLQAAFAARLVRRLAGPSLVLELSAGAVAVSMPIFILRFLHTALSSQFFLLWSLVLYLDAVGDRRVTRNLALEWTLLFVSVALVHPYLFVMCAAIFAATLVTWALRGRVRDAFVVGAVATGATVLVALVGGFGGAGASARAGVWGFGYKTTDLLSFVVPQWSTFFPWRGHPLSVDMTRDESSEGYAYAGAGAVAFVVVALVLGRAEWWPRLRRNAPLAVALALMAAFAVSHRISAAGHLLVELPLPDLLEWPARQFRSCGRFVWPLLYAATFLSMAIVFRRTRKLRPVFQGCVPLLALVQYVDAFGAYRYVGEYTSRAETRFLERSKVLEVLAGHRAITFGPSFQCVHGLRPISAWAQMEVEYAAAAQGIAMSSVRSSRPLRDCARDASDRLAPAVEDGRLYLLFPQHDVTTAETVHFERGGARCTSIGRAFACSRSLPSQLPPLVAPVDYGLGQRVAGEGMNPYMGSGWSWPEGEHRWSVGRESFFFLRLTEPLPPNTRLTLTASGAFLPKRPRASAEVRVNGVLAGMIDLTGDARPHVVPLPAEAKGQTLLEVSFRPTDARSPREVEGTGDERALGVNLVSFAIAP